MRSLHLVGHSARRCWRRVRKLRMIIATWPTWLCSYNHLRCWRNRGSTMFALKNRVLKGRVTQSMRTKSLHLLWSTPHNIFSYFELIPVFENLILRIFLIINSHNYSMFRNVPCSWFYWRPPHSVGCFLLFWNQTKRNDIHPTQRASYIRGRTGCNAWE